MITLKKNILVYGLGNFGYAFLHHLIKSLDHNSFSLHAFDRKVDLIKHIEKTGFHLYVHKENKIDVSDVTFHFDPSSASSKADIIILCINSSAILEVLNTISSKLKKNVIILNTAKALSDNGNTYSQEISKQSYAEHIIYGVISGGTIAKDLFSGYPLGATIAFEESKISNYVGAILGQGSLHVECISDVLGVEYAGAFKNVGAILAGYLYGKGYPYGTETFFLSLFLSEISDLCISYLECDLNTFSVGSHCWGNDFWMSCTGNTRNRKFGELLGSGYSYSNAVNHSNSLGLTVEGIHTITSLKNLLSSIKDSTQYKILEKISLLPNKNSLSDLVTI